MASKAEPATTVGGAGVYGQNQNYADQDYRRAQPAAPQVDGGAGGGGYDQSYSPHYVPDSQQQHYPAANAPASYPAQPAQYGRAPPSYGHVAASTPIPATPHPQEHHYPQQGYPQQQQQYYSQPTTTATPVGTTVIVMHTSVPQIPRLPSGVYNIGTTGYAAQLEPVNTVGFIALCCCLGAAGMAFFSAITTGSWVAYLVWIAFSIATVVLAFVLKNSRVHWIDGKMRFVEKRVALWFCHDECVAEYTLSDMTGVGATQVNGYIYDIFIQVTGGIPVHVGRRSFPGGPRELSCELEVWRHFVAVHRGVPTTSLSIVGVVGGQ